VASLAFALARSIRHAGFCAYPSVHLWLLLSFDGNSACIFFLGFAFSSTFFPFSLRTTGGIHLKDNGFE
jgi:hypothetical protein